MKDNLILLFFLCFLIILMPRRKPQKTKKRKKRRSKKSKRIENFTDFNDIQQKNIYDEPLKVCSTDPMTGWKRDGKCNTDDMDRGITLFVLQSMMNFRLY